MNAFNPSPRLLCVDDDFLLLQALVLGFRSHGFDVVTANHGLEALDQFKAHVGRFTAIITDTEMPVMDGATLVKHLRALDYGGRIIVMSGHWTAVKHRAYKDMIVNGFLQKPFEISMVATMLLQTD